MSSSGIRNMSQKTVIEILSDDSNTSDVDMDSEGDTGSKLIEAEEKPANLPDLTGDFSSGDEDLRHILKAARRVRTRNESDEQVASTSTSAPAVPSAPFLSAGIQAVFGDQVKRTYNFFNAGQFQTPQPRAEDALDDKTREDVRTSSKRKASYDPFAVHLLNIEPEGDDDERAKKKRRRHDKKGDRSRNATSSETPYANPQHQVPGNTSISKAPQNLNGPGLDAQGFVKDSLADGPSKRRQPVLPHQLNCPPGTSVYGMENGSRPRRPRSSFEQQVAPNTNSAAVPPIPADHQPSRGADKPEICQRAIIHVDADAGTEQTSSLSQVPTVADTQPSEAAGQHYFSEITDGPGHQRSSTHTLCDKKVVTSNSMRTCSGPGMLPRITSRQPSQVSPKQLRNPSQDASQTQPNGLQGYIGGHPEKRPEYARKQPTRIDRVVKKAKGRQLESGRVGKRTAVHKHQLQQSHLRANTDAEARLLDAQKAPGWREVLDPSAKMALKNGRAKAKGDQSQHAAIMEPQPMFRPNNNAYDQPIVQGDEDGDDDEHTTAASRNPAVYNDYQACRTSRSQPQTRSFGKVDHQRPRQPVLPQLHRQAPAPTPLHQRQLQRKPFTREEIDQAKADMTACVKKHTENRATMIANKLPPGFGAPEPPAIRRARQALATRKAKMTADPGPSEELRLHDMAKNCKKQKQRIRAKVKKECPHNSPETQEEEIEKRYAVYLKKVEAKFAKNCGVDLPSASFNAAFLENRNNDDDAHDGQASDLIGRMIPAYEALERLGPNVSLDKYSVLMSKPHLKREEASEFSRTKAFGQLDSANFYAHSILNDQTPPNPTLRKTKKKQQAYLDVFCGTRNGLFWGRGILSIGEYKGRCVSVMVLKEEQIVGDLAPDALRDMYVDSEVLDKYARDAYDVFMFNTIPKYFREAEKQDQNKLAIRKRQEEREQRMKDQAKQSAVEEEDIPTGLEGDELRSRLANLRPPGTSQHDADGEDTDRYVDDEEPLSDSQANDDSDASAGTIRSSSPDGDFHYLDCEPIHIGSFTNLFQANNKAIEVARATWKPRNANYDAIGVWKEKITPYLQKKKTQMMEMEHKELRLVFPGFEFRGPVLDHRPWGFTGSRLTVVKRELQGPVDLGVDFIQDVGTVEKAASFGRMVESVNQAEAQATARNEAQAVVRAVASGAEQGPEADKSLDDESSNSELALSDEEDYSEEE